MLQVQNKGRHKGIAHLRATDHCVRCMSLDPYARVDGCTEGHQPITVCMFGTSCQHYSAAPQCFGCGITIRPKGSSSVPLKGTHRVVCEVCDETLKRVGYFRYQDVLKWYPGDKISREMAELTHED